MIAERTVYTTIKSPFGTLVITGTQGKIRSMQFQADNGRITPQTSWMRTNDEFAEAGNQLAAYFAGELKEFSLPLDPVGTPFQKEAWRILCAVPYGETTTYGEIAQSMGRPNAYRAVGSAMNRNAITIIIPCHRVVGKNGSLTGYLNGVETKRRLLALEAAN